MIYLYSGTPGSGKSLHAAADIVEWSRSGRPVVGNFPVNLINYPKANYTYCENEKLTPSWLIEFSRVIHGDQRPKEDSILLVIDEAQLIFNAREWDKKGRAAWLLFFSQHRKFGYLIILCAQFDRMIDKQIRSLIEYEVVHRKVSNFGWKGRLLGLIMGGTGFVAIKRWYPLKEKVGHNFFSAKKKFYSIYDTFSTFSDQDGVTATPGRESGGGVPALPGGPAPRCPVRRRGSFIPTSDEVVDTVTDEDVKLNYTKQLLEDRESS